MRPTAPSGASVRAVRVHLPAALIALFPKADRQCAVTGATVSEICDALDRLYPGMRDRLCDSSPAVRRHINVFVNGERAQLATRVEAGSDVFIFTAMSGG